MSSIYTPKDKMLKASRALPALHTCIEAVVRDAVRTGRPEDSVRNFLRLYEGQFEGILATLHRVYDLQSTEEITKTSKIDKQPSLLPAAGLAEKQPSKYRDGFEWGKVEDGPDDDGDDDLAVDEDAEKTVVCGGENRFSQRPYDNLLYLERKKTTAASDALQEVTKDGLQPPVSPSFKAGFTAGVTVDRTPASDDGSDTPRQKTFVDSSSSPPVQPWLHPSASGVVAAVAPAEGAPAPPLVPAPVLNHFALRPFPPLSQGARERITNGRNTLRQAEERGLFKPLETPAVKHERYDGSETSRQNASADLSSPPERKTILFGYSAAFAVDVDGLSVIAVDPEKAKDEQSKIKVREWDDGNASSSGGALADLNLPAVHERRVAGFGDLGMLTDSQAETAKRN